ncbi:MAG: homoaconitate hydratase [Desulfobacterota bacterium]|nr:homoaconitate hydratase [Thermodesulfobacteriota bacterium]
MDEILIVDGTLREGEQSPGVFFTKDEKVEIALALDRAGVPLLDVGMPSISEEEREAIKAIAQLGLRASVGVSIRLRKEEVDQASLCGVKEVFVICPVSALHLRSRLGTDESGVRALLKGVIEYAMTKGLLVNLVAEDATRGDLHFLNDLTTQAYRWGARRVFLCDTVGVMEPFKMKEFVKGVREAIPEEMAIGVHCHNDFGLATANTLAAIEAGATFPSVTVNGIGERAGNPPLHEVVLALERIYRRPHRIDLKQLYGLSRLVERASGLFIPPHTPVVGFNAFRHESGIHVDGLLKNHQTYKAIEPEDLGRDSSFVLGKHTGAQAVLHLLKERGYEASEGEVREILRQVKARKTSEEKRGIGEMAKALERYYQEHLDFPLEKFYEIVEGVLGRRGVNEGGPGNHG